MNFGTAVPRRCRRRQADEPPDKRYKKARHPVSLCPHLESQGSTWLPLAGDGGGAGRDGLRDTVGNEAVLWRLAQRRRRAYAPVSRTSLGRRSL